MTDNVVGVDFNGVQFLLDSNTKLKRLIDVGAGTLTMHDTETNANYQVPVGKKFKIIFIETAGLAAVGDRIISSDTVDSTSDEVILLQPSATLTNLIFISTEVGANRFINYVEPGGQPITIYGVEEDV